MRDPTNFWGVPPRSGPLSDPVPPKFFIYQTYFHGIQRKISIFLFYTPGKLGVGGSRSTLGESVNQLATGVNWAQTKLSLAATSGFKLQSPSFEFYKPN